MTTSPAAAQPAGDVPALRRRADGRFVAGVAGGLADHLGVDALWVRLAFAVLTGISGFGLVLYAALWVFVPVERPEEDEVADEPAGLAAASRGGRRPRRARTDRRADLGQLVALAAIGGGVAFLLANTDIGLSSAVLWPLLIAGAGIALVWLQADEVDRGRIGALAPRPLRAAVEARPRVVTAVRVLLGLGLVVAGAVLFLAGQGELAAARDGLLATGVLLAGIGVVVGPFLWRLVRERDAERRERLLSQERADVAAHLHDSVLQTLALIQKQADDPKAVVALARAQERDLRGWLFGPGEKDATSFKAALARAAAEVEEAHGTPVEVVVVGDSPLDDDLRAVVAAAREAVVNAAKHSGATSVDVYAEVEPEAVEVFVRDRGAGFDPDAVPSDRLGLRGSVVRRMERHGGTATVRSAPGEGAEVRLAMGRQRS